MKVKGNSKLGSDVRQDRLVIESDFLFKLDKDIDVLFESKDAFKEDFFVKILIKGLKKEKKMAKKIKKGLFILPPLASLGLISMSPILVTKLVQTIQSSFRLASDGTMLDFGLMIILVQSGFAVLIFSVYQWGLQLES